MLGRAVNLYFITKYKNISTRKPKYCRAAMRIKEFILYGLIAINKVKVTTLTNNRGHKVEFIELSLKKSHSNMNSSLV